MTQIFTGSGLGVHGSSMDKVGDYGLKGRSGLGSGHHLVDVNAATGNLVMRTGDGFMAGEGRGFGAFRSYNSQGVSGSNWRVGNPGRLTIHGALNEEGSTIERLDEDGHCSRFVYDKARGCYCDTAGSTASFQVDSRGISYRESGTQCRYDYTREGVLKSVSDKDGHCWSFHYENDVLTSVTDSSGAQTITWTFHQGRLTDVTATSENKTIHHLHLNYDERGRVTREVMDLGEGKTFWTAYDYDGDSNRISGLRQSDGTSLSISYDAKGRVLTLSEGGVLSYRFSYEAGHTQVTNALNETWIYYYDKDNQLTGLDGPEGTRIRYRYEQGRLVEVTRGELHWQFRYNEAGDCIETISPEHGDSTRQYNSDHQLVAERHEDSLTRYVYDSRGHLRFKIAADGVVTEYRYNAQGYCESARTYLDTSFNDSTQAVLTEDALNQWVSRHSTTPVARTDYTYDWRGQLSQSRTFRAPEEAALITDYTFDAAGRMTSKTCYQEGKPLTTRYRYDDLGRLIESVDSQGRHQTIDYDDTHQRIITREPGGLCTIQIMDAQGHLLSSQRLDSQSNALGTTRYRYDAAGRLIAETAPDGGTRYWFYDKEGRLLAEVSADGVASDFRYDKEGHLTTTRHYATRLTINTDTTWDAIRPKQSLNDRTSYALYNNKNQLTYTIAADGALTGYRYNAQGLLVETTRFTTRLRLESLQEPLTERLCESLIQPHMDDRHQRYVYDSSHRLIAGIDAAGFVTTYAYDSLGHCWQTRRLKTALKPGELLNWPADCPPTSARDSVRYQRYDAAGLLIASMDEDGFLTEYHYNDAGRLSETIRYANASPLKTLEPNTSLAQLRPILDACDQHQYYQYNARGQCIEERGRHLTTRFYYDEASGLLLTKMAIDNKTLQAQESRYRYDSEGRLIQMLDARACAKLKATAPDDKDAYEAIWSRYATRYTYDALGRLDSKTTSTGAQTRYFYSHDGLLQASLDAQGGVCFQEYNAFGELTQTHQLHQRLSNPETITAYADLLHQSQLLQNAQTDVISRYLYDSKGQLVRSVINEITTESHYNAFGEVIETTQGTTTPTTTQFKYDVRGHLIEKTEDANGLARRIQMRYDSVGQMEHQVDSLGHLTRYVRDLRGHLLAEEDALGQSVQYRYDAFGRLIESTNTQQSTTTYRYLDDTATLEVLFQGSLRQRITFDGFGNRLTITDAAGIQTRYRYNEANQLIEESRDNQIQQRYEYDSEGRLTWQDNADHQTTTWTYDTQNRVLTQTKDSTHTALTTTYTYDALGRLMTQSNPDGLTTQFRYDNASRLIESIQDPHGLAIRTSYTYDEHGLLQQECLHNPQGTDKVSAWTYDALGRVQSRTQDPNGLALTTQYRWDSEGHLIEEIDARGNSRHFVYDACGQRCFDIDAQGNVTQYRYTSAGLVWQTIHYARPLTDCTNLTEATVANRLKTDAGDRYQTDYFDADKRLIRRCDAQGYWTCYHYDACGNLLDTTRLAQATPPVGRSGKASIEPVESRDDRITRYAYDHFNRLAFTINSLGEVTGHAYSPGGLLLQQTHYAQALAWDMAFEAALTRTDLIQAQLTPSATDLSTHFHYDSVGRVRAMVNPAGEVTSYQYDRAGRLTDTIRHAQPFAQPLLTDSRDRHARIVRDALGRERFLISPEGRVIAHDYDAIGNRIMTRAYAQTLRIDASLDEATLMSQLHTDNQDRVTQWQWDGAGRLTDQQEGALRHTHYEYDKGNNLLLKRSNQDVVWRWVYDESARMIESTTPNGALNRYRYDAFGQCIQAIEDAQGLKRCREYAYDARGLLIETAYPDVGVFDATSPISNARHEYRQRLTERTGYNAFGDITLVIDKAGQARRSLYDNAGRLIASVDACGQVTQFSYNTQGQLITSTQYKTPIALAADASLPLTTQALLAALQPSSGDRHEWCRYDNAGRLIERTKDVLRCYNPNSKTYSLETPTTRFHYNAFGELIQSDTQRFANDWNETRYQYNRDGDCISKRDAEGYVTTWDYTAFNQVSDECQYAQRISAEAFNQQQFNTDINDRKTHFGYDNYGQLIEKTLKNQSWQQFDESAHRVRTCEGDLTTRYQYNALGQMIESTDASGQRTSFYYDVEGHLLAKIGTETSRGRSATTYTYDALGQLITATAHKNGASNADIAGYRLNTASSEDVTTRYAYDSEGHVLEETDGEGVRLFYSYNANGQVARRWQQRHEGSGLVVLDDKRYTYDAENRLIQTRMLNAQGARTTDDAQYNAFGELIARGTNGRMTQRSDYDTLGRVVRSNANGCWQIYLYGLDESGITELITSSNHMLDDEAFDLSAERFDGLLNFSLDGLYYGLQRKDYVYDRTGHCIRQRVDSTKKTEDTLTLEEANQTWTYDAFGNVLTHTDALDNTTQYRYNGLNQVIWQKLPELSIMDEQGLRHQLAPVNYYAYDALGRAIAMTDANGHITAKVYDSEGHVVREIDAEGNHRDSEYNLLGQLSARTNARNHRISYRYDRNNHLVAIEDNLTGTTGYAYDEAGQLIRQTNATNEIIEYDYDIQNHLVQRKTNRGELTRYAYDDEGHKVAETDSQNRTQTWAYNDEGRLIAHRDLGNHLTQYRWTRNGLLREEISDTGKHHQYAYHGNGQLSQFADIGTTETVDYEYNAAGQLVEKRSGRAGDYKDVWLTEEDHYEYDAQGRLIAFKRLRPDDIDHARAPKDRTMLEVNYDYDATGNIRHTQLDSNYEGRQHQKSEDYFTYDKADRVLISKGQLQDKHIQITNAQGSAYVRDAEGNVIQALHYEDNTQVRRNYEYDGANQLKAVYRNDSLIDRRTYVNGQLDTEAHFNQWGVIETLDNYRWERGQLTGMVAMAAKGNKVMNRTSYTYNALNQMTRQQTSLLDENGKETQTITHQYRYDALWDTALLSEETTIVCAYDPKDKKKPAQSQGTSVHHYDKNGLLSDVVDSTTGRGTHYWNSTVDGLKVREDLLGKTVFLGIQGKSLGDLRIEGEDKQTLTVYGGFTPTGTAMSAKDFLEKTSNAAMSAPDAPQEAAGGYTVQAGDTLERIALQLYGDSSLWYMLADANGINSRNQALTPGQALRVPTVTSNQHQTSQTHQVVNGRVLYGETSATIAQLPAPKPPGSQLLAKIIVAAIAVIATVMIAGIIGPMALPAMKAGLATGFAILGGSAGGSMAASLAVGFVAGAAGALITQGAETALGLRDDINEKSALISGLATAASIGINGTINQLKPIKSGLDALKNLPGANVFNYNQAAVMMEQDSVSQAIRLSTQRHQHFNFQELGANGILAGLLNSDVSKNMTQKMDNQLTHAGSTSAKLINSASRNTLQAALTGGHINAESIIADTLGDTLGSTLTETLQQQERELELQKQTQQLKAKQETRLAIQRAAVREMERGVEEGGYCGVPEGFYDHEEDDVNLVEAEPTTPAHEETTTDTRHWYNKAADTAIAIGGYIKDHPGDAVSIAMDFVPIVSQVKAGVELVTGYDAVSGRNINRALAAIALIPGAKVAAKSVAFLKETKYMKSAANTIKESRYYDRGFQYKGEVAEFVSDKTMSLRVQYGYVKAMSMEGFVKSSRYLGETGSKTLSKSYDAAKATGRFVGSKKSAIIKHSLNASVGATSSYASALATADQHPFRAALIGGAVAFFVGRKPASSYSEQIKKSVIGNGAANLVYQGIGRAKGEQNSISVFNLGVSMFTGATIAAHTYGMPLMTSAIIGYGPSTVIPILGNAINESFTREK